MVWINRHEEVPNLVDDGDNIMARMIGEDMDLVVGPISTNAGDALVKKESWEDIMEENTIKLGGEEMMAYSFLDEAWTVILDGQEGLTIEKVEL
jgi:hypothetical protein